MKIYPDRLDSALRKTLLPVYLVSGDEPLLIQEVCDELRTAFRNAGYVERDLFHVESGFDWQQVLYSNNSMSLFAEKKIIELRMTSDKPGVAGAKALTELTRNLSADNCLLLLLPKLERSTQQTKWFKAVESAGGFIQVWPVGAGNMAGWLRGRFQRVGLQASRDALQALAYRTEGNLLAAVQEIERIKLCSRTNIIDVEQITGGVADSARYDVFLMIDAALEGNAERAIRIVEGLEMEGVAPLFLNTMLAREIRSLTIMASKMEQGQSADAVMKRSRVWGNRMSTVSACLKRHRRSDLERIQLRLGNVDRMVKGLTPGRPWDELAAALLALSG